MQIQIISSPHFFSGEIEIIKGLLEENLDVLYIRKPQSDRKTLSLFLSKIPQKWHYKIMIPYSEGLEDLEDLRYIRGFHFNKKSIDDLKGCFESKVNYLHKMNKRTSTGIHLPKNLSELPENIGDIWLSPVFKSISKQNYLPTVNWNPIKLNLPLERVVALGGVNQNNIDELKTRGFKKLALMGAIWTSNNQIKTFKDIKKLCLEKDLLS
ncbi:beta/alpha barrel domain-containing protein [Ichthyobacterium seriolicida]|uniref:Thiamin-phosphate pyrophosphorylase n=1 Tax=Ichthyobacterium seriolicida TaxID=242600 RepID=A0A1J1E216_9FLAO|nr:hypothetical protein [Ichthyobacterium seriolicida]BAV94997.1 thiamin-phosphate pyrophosphorylase [Ichthyobacterium seriolicida]